MIQNAVIADEGVDIDKNNTKTTNKKTTNNKTNNRNATKRNAGLDDVDTSSEEETVDDQQLHPDYEDGAQATSSVVTETVAPVSRPNLKFPKPNDYVKCIHLFLVKT